MAFAREAVAGKDPGTPDHRSPARYLLWPLRARWRAGAAGASLGVVWMVAQALMPAALGRAIGDGVAARDERALLTLGRGPARHRRRHGRVRDAGVAAARAETRPSGAEVLLPGLLIALVTWVGARFAVRGTIGVGEPVSCYGYAVFLIIPLKTLGEAAGKIIQGYVAVADGSYAALWRSRHGDRRPRPTAAVPVSRRGPAST